MIHYRTGDATCPVGPGSKVLAHVCNDRGAWGAGFTGALSRRWPEPEDAYRGLRERRGGEVQYVEVDSGLVVANMIAQRGIVGPRNPVPLRMDWLRTCLGDLFATATARGWSVHAPRFGAGLAGGDWGAIAALVEALQGDVPVTVYDLAPRCLQK